MGGRFLAGDLISLSGHLGFWPKSKLQSDLNTKGNGTMLNSMTTWIQLKTDRRAVTALEYGLIASLIAVVIIAGVSLLGTSINSMFANVAGNI